MATDPATWGTPPQGETWPDGRPKMWCDKHARWCAHTTDACTLNTKGGKAGKGGPSDRPYPRCMLAYPRCQGVRWNILRKIHAYFLWLRTKTASYGRGKKCRKVF